ncbi:ion channel [Pseudomonas syringae]|uniref:ion channel n=1 Tax=Pseudomonas syringae TaxID=317 RepID=UPI003F82670D
MKEITTNEMVRILLKGGKVENCKIVGEVNHETLAPLMRYEKHTNEWHIIGKLIFKKCIFDIVDFRQVFFENRFEMRYCTIRRANFKKAKFKDVANFSTTRFLESANFDETWFLWSAYFSNTLFECDAGFFFAYFKEWLIFHSASFSKGVNFTGATFEKRALFGGITANTVKMTNTHFFDAFAFNSNKDTDTSIHELDLTGCDSLKNINLSTLRCKTIILNNLSCKGTLNLSETVFEKIDLTGTNYSELTIDLEDLFQDENSSSKLLITEDKNFNKSLSEIYSRLKSNSQKLGMRDQEDLLYRRIRRIEAVRKKFEKKHLQYIIDKYILDCLFGYGTLPYRAFAASILTIMVFTVTYLLIGISNVYPSVFDKNFTLISIPNYLYFSTITFTTIGYGDISPKGFPKLIAATEGFLGVFMMGAFSVTFARKLLR